MRSPSPPRHPPDLPRRSCPLLPRSSTSYSPRRLRPNTTMSNPRHPLLGVNPSPRPTQDTKPKRHPTFFVSSASPSPALAPSTDDSPEIIPSAAPTQPNPHRAPGTKHITTTQSMSERLRRRSEGYGSYDPPGTDPTYSVPLNDIAQTSGIAYSAPTTNTIEPQRPDPSSVEISTQSLPAPTYSQSAQTSPTRSRRTSTSYMFGPRRPSRASLAALRSALQEYQVPSPHTPERRAFTEERMGLAGRSMSTLDLKSAASAGLGLERMHALVEIHRVLYRGREGGAEGWEKQVGEVRRVVERWFEADCGESSRGRSPWHTLPSTLYTCPLFALTTSLSLCRCKMHHLGTAADPT